MEVGKEAMGEGTELKEVSENRDARGSRRKMVTTTTADEEEQQRGEEDEEGEY